MSARWPPTRCEVAGSAANAIGNAASDTVFSAVDYATDGAISLQYHDGNFNAHVGIPDTPIGTSLAIGKDGVSASADLGVMKGDFSVNSHGVEAGYSAGIDIKPLPYFNAHAAINDQGVSLDANGHVTIPLPVTGGILSAEGGIDYEHHGDTTSVSGSLGATYTEAEGTSVGATVHGSYEQDAHGEHWDAGGTATLAQEGVGEVSVGVDHSHDERDGNTVDKTSEGASASTFGVTGSLGATETSGTVGGRSFDNTTTTSSLDVDPAKMAESLLDASGVLKGEGEAAGAAAIEGNAAAVESAASSAASQVGSVLNEAGGLGSVATQIGGDATSSILSQVGSVLPGGGTDLFTGLASSGNLTSVIEAVGGKAAGALVGQVGNALGVNTSELGKALGGSSMLGQIAGAVGKEALGQVFGESGLAGLGGRRHRRHRRRRRTRRPGQQPWAAPTAVG